MKTCASLHKCAETVHVVLMFMYDLIHLYIKGVKSILLVQTK